MRILAIDTTSAFGSLALHENGRTLEEVLLHAPEGFGPVLFSQIDALLRKYDWPLPAIDVFAAASGPGSFTGVRIGIAAVKGLAEATGRGALAISNLKALAEFGRTNARGTLLDARRGEVYAAIYDANSEAVSPEVVSPLEAWLSSLRTPPEEIISTDFSAFREAFPAAIPVTEQRTLASAIARIAERTPAMDPALLDANYVRRSDAELFWTDKK